jgi:hypothetical protein
MLGRPWSCARSDPRNVPEIFATVDCLVAKLLLYSQELQRKAARFKSGLDR